jgi:hypothetical protein
LHTKYCKRALEQTVEEGRHERHGAATDKMRTWGAGLDDCMSNAMQIEFLQRVSRKKRGRRGGGAGLVVDMTRRLSGGSGRDDGPTCTKMKGAMDKKKANAVESSI